MKTHHEYTSSFKFAGFFVFISFYVFLTFNSFVWVTCVEQKRVGDVPLPSYMVSDEDMDKGPEYCLDAGNSGNVARFINHSCQPNLFVQCVLSTHHDAKLARVVLFASDNIPPLKVFSSQIPMCLFCIYLPLFRYGFGNSI